MANGHNLKLRYHKMNQIMGSTTEFRMGMTWPVIFLLIMTTMGTFAQDPLKMYTWKNRVVIVLGENTDHPLYSQQLKELNSDSAVIQQRDIVILSSPGNDLSAGMEAWIHEKYPVMQEGFRIVLIGKDGTVKYDAHQPISADELYAIIDAMPMRRREMRQQGDQ